jgi:hypothetical protein
MKVGGQRLAQADLQPGKTLGTHYLGGPVWTVVENLSLPGFHHRTVQRIASRYTD